MRRWMRTGAVVVLGAVGCGGEAGRELGEAGAVAAELPVDSGYIVADDGLRLYYRTIGDGPTQVVIPSGFYLEESLARLAAPDRRLVFYDPRARGRSEAGDRSRITLERQLGDLESVRRAMGIDSMALIGWSGLGMELAVYAFRHPERVTRLVQVAPVAARDEPHNAAAYAARGERMDPEAVAELRSSLERGAYDGDPAGHCRALREVSAPASFADPARLAETPDICRHPNEYPDSLALIWGPLLGSFRGYDWREEAAALDVPRLVIHGAADAFPVAGSEEWVPAGAPARLLVLEGAGHFPFLERPEAFFPAVDAFLRGEWSGEGALPGGG